MFPVKPWCRSDVPSPIRGCTCSIGERQLVPWGVVGEIYIGGAGVARGYLNRPELTAERFVEDHLTDGETTTLYRTGDLGRLRADGVFEFAGRMDDQIKIRGVRVELGEIEAAIVDHPGVRAAAVVCDERPSGARLIAYVVPRGSEPMVAAELRSFVRDRIPAGLIPNRFESIASLPMTPSGKLDRRSLPAVSEAEEHSSFLPPRNEFEARLAGIWEDVLQARPIGIRDDFFALGGHSLSAVQVAVAMERALGRALSPGLLFEAPTIELLSSRLSATSSGEGHQALVLLSRGQSGAPLFLVHHVSGDITAYRDLANHLGTARSIYGVRVPELDGNGAPLDRVEAMAARYVGEIRALQPQGPYLLGGHSAGAPQRVDTPRQNRCRAGTSQAARQRVTSQRREIARKNEIPMQEPFAYPAVFERRKEQQPVGRIRRARLRLPDQWLAHPAARIPHWKLEMMPLACLELKPREVR